MAGEENQNSDVDGCASCVGCIIFLTVILPIIVAILWIIGAGITCLINPNAEICQPVEEVKQEKVQEVVPTNETHNGIAFEVISKRLVNEAYLRGFGIPSMGNSPVLVITVKIKTMAKSRTSLILRLDCLMKMGQFMQEMFTQMLWKF